MEIKRWATLASEGEWFHFARFHFLPGRNTQLHTHDFPEIFWLEKGAGLHFINGEKIALAAGDLVFIRPADQHVLRADGQEGFHLVNLAFPMGVLEDLRARHPEIGPFHREDCPLPCGIALDKEQRRRIQEELSWFGRSRRGRLALERFLLILYAILMPDTESPAEVLPDWLERACQEIRRPENFAGGTAAFTKLAGRSPEHVTRVMQAKLGVNPTDYVNEARLEHAARELRFSNRPIIEIALECGINNLSYFYSLFRRQHQMTPRRYRLFHQRAAL